MAKETRRYGHMPTRRGPTKRLYEVRVIRVIEEESIDIEIRASSEEEAKALALKEARANHALLFSDIGEPSYEATDAEPI